MKALGDRRPDEKANSNKKPRVGVSPGPKARPEASNPPAQENFDESVQL
tara:strand:+ start:655 stop:801 length:147 start_codon:yes stop_codon:yes gene_type:complete